MMTASTDEGIEGSGQPEKIDINDNDFGSGMEISDQAEDQSEEIMKVSLLNSEDLMPETEENEEEEEDNTKNEGSELNTEDADGDGGSGEFELIITLPDLSPEGSGSDSGGEFEITRKKKGLQTGEAVFQALVDFLLPDSKNSLVSNDKSFKDLFNIFAS